MSPLYYRSCVEPIVRRHGLKALYFYFYIYLCVCVCVYNKENV